MSPRARMSFGGSPMQWSRAWLAVTIGNNTVEADPSAAATVVGGMPGLWLVRGGWPAISPGVPGKTPQQPGLDPGTR
jgi:hypothetical protein